MRRVGIPNHRWIEGKEVNLHQFVAGLYAPIEKAATGHFFVKVVFKSEPDVWHTFDPRRGNLIQGGGSPVLTESQRTALAAAVDRLQTEGQGVSELTKVSSSVAG